ncbi:fdxN element excision recombinase XisF [Nostoc sp. DedQUE07]|uniref:fdxN element excision recombinase XisF n=1 Tax=Nostoc sp. DedQUE07 TaxID=3075392 RepID=UPI002AD471BD|nr:fdxN element excision recombinase XisF [Nostoc sp. DedQUE07]MDZ8131997.1 fdxN element excision recombinase XisF [Nostoc sp. DedQUE07]
MLKSGYICFEKTAIRRTGYARLSRREQTLGTHTLEQHIARLRSAGATEVFWDIASRSRDDRVGLNKILKMVSNGETSEVIMIRIDRMTDSHALMEKAINIFLDAQIPCRGLDDNIDFSTVGGRMHARILVTIARGEVERLQERVLNGWEFVRERVAAVNPPFGYKIASEKHQLDTSPFLCLRETKQEVSKAAIGREIVEAFLKEKTLRLALRFINERYGITTYSHGKGRYAQGLFRFSPGGLRDWLLNPVIRGHICYLRKRDGQRLQPEDWDIRYNTHPEERLITDEEFGQIQAILKHNKQVRGYGATALKYPLSGLIFCGECRSACYSVTGSRGRNLPGLNYYFQCKNWRLRACPQKQMVRMEVAEESVVNALITAAEKIATQYAFGGGAELEPTEIRELRSRLQALNEIAGYDADIEAAKEKLRFRIKDKQYSLSLQNQQQNTSNEKLLSTFLEKDYWRTLMDGEKQIIYRTLVEKVVVRFGEVEKVVLKV